jgi:hypothetical protein
MVEKKRMCRLYGKGEEFWPFRIVGGENVGVSTESVGVRF